MRAFAFFGAVLRRLIYDNLSAAVKRIVGLKDQELTDRFKVLVSHYLFEPCFARRGEGHDKGGVEGRGKNIRLQHLTPIVAGPGLDAISVAVLGDIERHWRQRCHADGRLLSALFEEDRAQMLALPAAALEARCMEPVSISRSATAKVHGALYSLPERWARLDAEAWVGPQDIRFRCRGEEQTRERQRPGGKRIVYRDYLRELSRKPQAVRQVAPELTLELGEPYRRLWALLEQTHGGKPAARILAGVLGAIDDHGEATVTAALCEAMVAGAFEADGDGNLLADRYERRSTLVATNLAFAEWVQVFGDEKLTTALLDRLAHHSHILTTRGKSYRTGRGKRGDSPQITKDNGKSS